jgi:hypothetical protein
MASRLWIATRKGLFRAERSRSGWELKTPPAFLGDPVSMVLEDPRDGAVYAALALGHFGNKLHRSDDGGATWTEVGAPSYAFAAPPEMPSDVADAALAKAPALELVWALEPGGADQADVLWCGTIPGALFRSADRGATWEPNLPLWERPERAKWFGGGYPSPGIHSVEVDPRDSKHVTIGVSCGGVWTSFDSGASWEVRTKGMFAEYMPEDQRENPEIQDPHRMVACPGAPDALWVQHHNGIFRTTDGGLRWSHCAAAAPSGFGFGVAVDPNDPDTAWFVPGVKDERRVPVDARLVVTRTRDGGASFETLAKGLPSEPAYDVIFRHALAIDDQGASLAFGSTTGNVFVSGDRGESWSALSTYLPPVYAVRFAG